MRQVALTCYWLAAGLVSPLAWGQGIPAQPEGIQWLQRISTAAQKLSYSGTFIYRNGTRSEISRIAHIAENGRQLEKVEVLDGSPREVIRDNNEVSCYLPEKRLVIIEQRSVRRGFPSLLPASLAGLGDHYLVRKGATARVAGFDSQIVRLEPRDKWRYGHQLWVDIGSGLLLKAEIFDASGESLESMAFTDLRIGDGLAPDAVKSSYAKVAKESWKIRRAKLTDMRDDAQWQFRTEVPGFRKQAAMKRSTAKHGDDVDMLHWVFSDGLVALSVFISPVPPDEGAGEDSLQTMGALSVLKRVVAGYQIVVMGDLPPAVIRSFADGIGVRGK